jgi:hypothetical protein
MHHSSHRPLSRVSLSWIPASNPGQNYCMPNEIEAPTTLPVGTYNVYAILYSPTGQPYIGSNSFENWIDGHVTTYANHLTQQGTNPRFIGNFPSDVTVAGNYSWEAYQQMGGSPAITDTLVSTGFVSWNGPAEADGSGTEPISLSDMKLHLRYLLDDQDSLITSYIVAAIIYCENFCKRTFTTGTSLILNLDHFPHDGGYHSIYPGGWNQYGHTHHRTIHLPNPPVVSIDVITYVDINGVQQTLAPSAYQTDLINQAAPRLAPIVNTDWPSTQHSLNSVLIHYTAGYPSGFPANLVHAIRLLVGDWFRNQREASTSPQLFEAPFSVKNLLWPLKTF